MGLAALSCGGRGDPEAYELGRVPEGYTLCVAGDPVPESGLVFQVTYQPVEGQGGLTLFGLSNDTGLLLDGADVPSRDIRGTEGVVLDVDGAPNVVAWFERDDLELRMVSFTVDVDEMVALADSVQPLEGGEFDSLVELQSCA